MKKYLREKPVYTVVCLGIFCAMIPGITFCSSKAQVRQENKEFIWQSGIKILRPANLLQFSVRRALSCVCPSATTVNWLFETK